MNNKENKSFLDPNTIFALIITFVLFFGWQQYLKVKHPEANKKALVKAEQKKQGAESVTSEQTDVEKVEAPKLEPVNQELIKPTVINVSNEYWSFDLNSVGMQVENIKIININKVENKPYSFSYPKTIFPTYYNDKELNFKITQTDEKTMEGIAMIPNGGQIKKTINIDSESFTLRVKIDVIGVPKDDSFKISHPFKATIEDPKKIIFFLPAFDRNELYVESSDGQNRRILNTEDKSEEIESFTATKLYSLSDHYFSVAYLSEGKLLPSSTFSQSNENLNMNLTYDFSREIDLRSLEYSLFLGPKRLDLLEKTGTDLLNLIDFTFLGFIARPIVKALNYIYSLVGNYGLAVIILTFLIRLLILPLAVSSFKSMKKMQKIQPKLKEIKEKYKDDKQKINQMTMQIMKDNNVNPMGGCLPMLLQLPIFFAFYRGLSESVDLYQAPFFLWIDDLTKVDPYFILPILSIIGMLIHQLVTPNTMDKAQKRMMLFMPLVFGAFIFTLPSALTLYMVVTTWFGIGQHAIFLREKPAQ